jgi:long-subunit acyl-CoA synthetase (AMP-forming)
LIANGVNPQQKILIISRNTPSSTTIYLATQFVGAISVPLFTNLKLKELEFVFKDSNASIAFVEDKGKS